MVRRARDLLGDLTDEISRLPVLDDDDEEGGEDDEVLYVEFRNGFTIKIWRTADGYTIYYLHADDGLLPFGDAFDFPGAPNVLFILEELIRVHGDIVQFWLANRAD